MYTIEWCDRFTGFKKIEELNLHHFALFFEEHLANRLFIYATNHPLHSSFSIEVRGNQLPHLMGLQRWNHLEVKQPDKQYSKLLSGEWDLLTLSKVDQHAFNEQKERIGFLPYLYQLLHKGQCEIKMIQPRSNHGFDRRRVNMIFRKDGSKLVYLLELREKPNEPTVYIPVSITVHRPRAHALQARFIPLNVSTITVRKI